MHAPYLLTFLQADRRQRRLIGLCIASCLAMFCGTALGVPPFEFADVSASKGIGSYIMAEGMGGGAAAADFDDDGDIDLFVPTGAGVPDQLYRNLGNGQFEEIAQQAGLDSTVANRTALWFDYDADGVLDLLVANDVEDSPTMYRLYRQVASGQFEDVTVEAGLMIPPPAMIDPGNQVGLHRGGFCAADMNGDGYLDVYAPLWNGPGHFFVNNGNGGFTDSTVTSRLNAAIPWAHQCMMADFNEDGWLDIYVAVDFNPNELWINRQNGQFSESAVAAGADNSMNDMGLSLGDYDGDADLDVYVTNWYTHPASQQQNILLRNDTLAGQVSFQHTEFESGVDNGGWGWGTSFFDADLDGRLDIAATNGFIWSQDPSKFFWNKGGDPLTFEDVSTDVSFDDMYWGSALIAFDYDRDGDQDMIQTCMEGPLRLLENQRITPGDANYLVIKPRMAPPNVRAIGAVVRIVANGVTQIRLITAGTSYLGQEPAEAFFGIGAATLVDSVTVEWPDGTQDLLTDVNANQVLTVQQTGPPLIPAVSAWGVLIVLLLLLLAGTAIIRDRALLGRR